MGIFKKIKTKIQKSFLSTGEQMKRGIITPDEAFLIVAKDFLDAIYDCTSSLEMARESAIDNIKDITKWQNRINECVENNKTLNEIEKFCISTTIQLSEGKDVSMASRENSFLLGGANASAFKNLKQMCPDPNYDWSYEHLIDVMMTDSAVKDLVIQNYVRVGQGDKAPSKEALVFDRNTIEWYLKLFIRYSHEILEQKADISTFFNENGFVVENGVPFEEDFITGKVLKIDLKGLSLD